MYKVVNMFFFFLHTASNNPYVSCNHRAWYFVFTQRSATFPGQKKTLQYYCSGPQRISGARGKQSRERYSWFLAGNIRSKILIFDKRAYEHSHSHTW